MIKTLLSCLILLSGLFTFGQTAANFNCNDCATVNHDLFTELDAGKVVVVCWVMPCSSCINGALSAQSACQSFSASNPGQVYFYCADDYGNTSCSSLNSWCTTNGVTNSTARFSNSAVSMSNYGAAGMPKVVVLGGGTSHTVYYNQNSPNITTSGIQSAISTALSAVTGVEENNNGLFESAAIFPNPSNTSSRLSFNLTKDSKCNIYVQNQLGQEVAEVFNGNLQKGENSVQVNTSELSSGTYFINFSDGSASKKIKLIIVR